MYNFKKEERLCNKRIIARLFNEGASFFAYPFKVKYLPIDLDTPSPVQVLISVSKRNQRKAVDRNATKRRIREAYRLQKQPLYDTLRASNRQYAIALLYTGKHIPQFNDIKPIIFVILQRLVDENEKYSG